MKDFKFRGEGVESGEWVYGDLIVINGYSYILPQHHRYGVSLEQIYQKLVPVIASTVCQYTGLRDKNGNEIYQGDIIRCPKYYETPENSYNPIEIAGKVVFEEGCWRLSEGGYLYDEHVSYGGELEVIGNDHDTPNL